MVTCQAVAPASGSSGGETFTVNSDGSDPGFRDGVYFDTSPGGTMELASGSSLAEGATTLSLTDPKGGTALAVTGQMMTLTGATGTYTVTADSFAAEPPHVPDKVTITPGLALTSPTKPLTKSTVRLPLRRPRRSGWSTTRPSAVTP